MLAAPAGGPVDRVWFSSGGSTLYARTRAGNIFQTADFETWSPAPDATEPSPSPSLSPARRPEAGAIVVAAADGSAFAMSRNLYRSNDGGRSWNNLTAYKSHPVIGPGQRSVAVSPSDPAQIAVANDFGVWRSMDGGLTWTGLNESLPNLPVRKIVATPTGAAGTRIRVDGLPVTLELPPGGSFWMPVPSAAQDDEEGLKARYSDMLGVRIQSVAAAGATVYAGSSDGRIWYSSNDGQRFEPSNPTGVSGPVERIWVDPAHPDAALAAVGGTGAHVLHTFNGGRFWDVIDSNLPAAHSVTADASDASAGAVYVATDKGVFWAVTDLLGSSGPLRWTAISEGLPADPVYDVKLDPAGVQLYVAVDGYGVYATLAPHRRRALRIVSAADFSAHPAAPGSLMSVVGQRVTAVRGADLDYPVLAASDAESQIQVPFAAVGPTVALALNTAAGAVTLPVQVQPAAPVVFVARDGAPMLYDADSGLPVDGRNPAKSNGRVQIFATGLGRVRPDLPAGMPAPLQDPPVVVAEVKAFLNGQPLQVTRATAAPGYVGAYVVEVQLPVIANFGSNQLYISAGGQDSNRVQIVIEP
ncbi:MAG: hypothetical protein LAQ30_09340 [Acidobacteriia bacterium]|nr:hypothetical protein [Terriglobia bacterium]